MFKPEESSFKSFPKKTLAPHAVHDVVIRGITLKLVGKTEVITLTVRGKEVINELPDKYQICTGEYWCTNKDNPKPDDRGTQNAVNALCSFANVLGIKDSFVAAIDKANSIPELVQIADTMFKNKEVFAVTGKIIGKYNDRPYEKGFLPRFGPIHKTRELAQKYLTDKLNSTKDKQYFTKIDKSFLTENEPSGPIGTPVEDDGLPF